MNWLRLYHEVISDPKWPAVARRAQTNQGTVVSVWVALLIYASQQDERGSVDGFCATDCDALYGYDDGTCQRVIDALKERGVIQDGKLAAWDKRQPKRERETDETSTERVRKYRQARAVTSCNANETALKHHETPCNANENHETPPDKDKIKIREDKDYYDAREKGGVGEKETQPPVEEAAASLSTPSGSKAQPQEPEPNELILSADPAKPPAPSKPQPVSAQAIADLWNRMMPERGFAVSGDESGSSLEDVEDETIMTLTLARDMEPTSNKYYPTVNTTNTAFEDLTDEVSEAVQWQLVKATKEPTYKAYDYYYIKDGKATIKNAGDTVAVQPYNLQLVKDGQVVNKYISINGTTVSLTGSKTDVYIKENVDGSVSIKAGSFNANQYMSVQNYRDAEFKNSNRLGMRSVSEESEATEVKLYLASDAPVISWQNQGHATLQSEEGLYITMEENNDGKVNSIEPETFYLTKTDTNKAIPSFYISKGINGDAATERMYLFNPVDSIPYLVNAPVDERYQWDEETTKAIFKAGTLLTPDTMKTIIKAEETVIAQKADNWLLLHPSDECR